MEILKSYVGGAWVAGSGELATLVNPATEEPLAQAGAAGVDRGAALRYARDVGGPALRAMSFRERAGLLKAVSDAIQSSREELIELAVRNGGNTRGDAKFDVDGAAFVLTAYADLGEELGEAKLLPDGDGVTLGRSPRFHGQHIRVTRRGVAIHINAFNFPAWGFAEKAAPALLAGMPVLSKPATSSAMVAARLMEILVEKQTLPAGALSLLAGSAGDLLDHVGPQDVVAFTGSSDTAATIRRADAIIRNSVRVNVEADSLNAAVFGPDADPEGELYDYALKDVLRDMTQKAGQKCTAIRRVLVPAEHLDRVRDDLVDRLKGIVFGNPAERGVRMGPVATRQQLEDVRSGIAALARDGRVVVGGAEPVNGSGAPDGKGFFVAPTLVEVEAGAEAPTVHGREVFGPVANLVPYDGKAEQAAEIVGRGRGGLVCSIYSEDATFAREAILGVAPYHGRVFLGSVKISEMSGGPGTVLPQLVHGGPGRAGGGEELGGLRGLALYTQRVALQGARPIIERIAGTKG